MFWPFHTLENRRARIQEAVRQGMLTGDAIRAEMRKLKGDLGQNRNLKELAQFPGWRELDETLSKKAIDLLRGLPDLVLADKTGEAKASAAYIKIINDLLGLVNRSLFETQLCANLIDSHATMLEEIKERSNAR